MFSHEEINERFLRLDLNPVILQQSFHGWWAWPIVKERLWLYCLNNGGDGDGRSRKGGVETITRLASGIWQVLVNLVFAGKSEGVMLYEERYVSLPDGRKVHPHLGELTRIEQNGPWLHYRFPWGEVSSFFPRAGKVEDYGISSLVALGSFFLRRGKVEVDVSRLLVDELLLEFPKLKSDELYYVAADQLARFRCRFIFSKWLLKRWGVSKVVVLDSDGKIPEIAAAKSLGLSVTEVQHGMFSADEPDYSWRPLHRNLPHKSPLPDKVIVFGPLWANQLREAGFWRGNEIIEAQNPVIGEYFRLRKEKSEKSLSAYAEPLTVLFPTQEYIKDDAIRFWRSVLELSEVKEGKLFHLAIKIHPLEICRPERYVALAKDYPDIVSIVPANKEAFEEMLSVDIVAGYTSLMLIEALGIGLSVVGLEGVGAGKGMSETFRMPELESYICSCKNQDEFLSFVKNELQKREESLFNGVSVLNRPKIYSAKAPCIESILLS